MSTHNCGFGREGGVQRMLYSSKEAETILGISHATLYHLINSGHIDARKIGGKAVITHQSLEAFIAALPAVKAGEAA